MPYGAVLFRFLQVVGERGVGDAHADESRNRYKTAVAQAEFVRTAPDFAEEDVVIQSCELGCEVTELVAPGGLFDGWLCHKGGGAEGECDEGDGCCVHVRCGGWFVLIAYPD